MKLNDQFRFVQQNMKKNKTRVTMTILATAMGCAFLIVLASVGFGLHKSIVEEVTRDRLVTEIEVHGRLDEKESYQALTDKDVQYLEGIKHVKTVTRKQSLQQDGVYKIGEYEAFAQTIITHIPSEIKAGFELSEGRLPKGSNEIMVGYDFIKSLRPANVSSEDLYEEEGQLKEQYTFKNSIVNQEIEMTVKQYVEGKEKTKTIPLTIVGIGKKPTREWMEDRTVFISQEVLKEIEKFTGTPRGMVLDPNIEEQHRIEFDENSYDQVKVYASNLESVKGISEELKKNHYPSYSVVNELDNINKMFLIVKSGLVFVGTIAIIIASIGIYNTMTMAVTERAPDIGIMKAIGASPKTIKKIFLLESSYIGLIGAIIGTAVSYGISKLVNVTLPFIINRAFGEQTPEDLVFSYIPINLPIICIIICYFVTVASGYRPAQRATKVDVLKAMRREV
ncbi:ABC transporter permease [Bacillus sp. 31A1R]|uniref:ABC transporter permease n=1 Tax=Robertmurraya mangrovi TaxID=3098077 RepID=A0ABU5J4J8_9BACI|nr:ABC transporter permease [Bacillus sp. 31A1R]MDZ5474308.1 ABC transporter permease [Bacillus sp. 31A1R]